MTHLVVLNDSRVLSRLPFSLDLTWLDIDVSRCTDYRYALTFDRRDSAERCAGMHGAQVHIIGDYDAI
jgi:hypothetical protein